MMKIDFTKEAIENEIGPNLYFMGSMNDFLKLKEDIDDVLIRKHQRLVLNELDYVDVISDFGNCQIVFTYSDVSSSLAEIRDSELLTILNESMWIKLSEFCHQLSQRKGHIYIEFDNIQLNEDYNIVWSSEW